MNAALWDSAQCYLFAFAQPVPIRAKSQRLNIEKWALGWRAAGLGYENDGMEIEFLTTDGTFVSSTNWEIKKGDL